MIIKLKFTAFVVAVSILLSPIQGYAERVTLTTIMPTPTQLKRNFRWNGDHIIENITGITKWQVGNTTHSDFGVSIPVKAGDWIEVTFSGSVAGKVLFAVPMSVGFAQCHANQVIRSDTDVFKPYVSKSLYYAKKDEVLTFRQQYWYSDDYPSNPVNVGHRYCSAEILSSATSSPAQ